MISIKSSKMFITGCDARTRWQLPWFEENFYLHNPEADLRVFDFDKEFMDYKGWFKKPAAMIKGSTMSDNVCWIDTDCHVLGNLDEIWDHVVPNKLSMAQDMPWTTRSGETWHNSGVVAFTGLPQILSTWDMAVRQDPIQGDQETLHLILKEGMRRMIHINDLPRRFNVLRIDHLDNTVPAKPLIHHWTGQKGNDKIKELMNG